MGVKLYVGNLSYETTSDDLANLFKEVGAVESINIITDRDTGRSKGFAFVELEDKAVDRAIAQFNGVEIKGRALTINEASPKEGRPDTRMRPHGPGGGDND